MSVAVDSLSARQREVWAYMRAHPNSTLRALASALGVSAPTVLEHIGFLHRAGLCAKHGSRWAAIEPPAWLDIDDAPYDGTEVILGCPDDPVNKQVFGAYRTDHANPRSVPAWRERITGFVVHPAKFMHKAEDPCQ